VARRPDPVEKYARAVATGKTVAGPYVRLAGKRHLKDLKARKKTGLVWDLDKALRAIEFVETMLPLEDGREFLLQPFQKFIVGSLFGWYGPEGFRRFRTAYNEIGKGNGKSPLAAAIGIYGMVADGEPAAEVYSAATTQDQARIVWKDAQRMVESAPELAALVDVQVGSLSVMSTHSVFRPVSSEHRGLDGKRVHIGLIDELHEHPTAMVVDKIRAGTKARRNALIFEITNSGFDRTSVCWAHHEYSVRVLEGTVDNEAWFAYVCALDGLRTETLHFDEAMRCLRSTCTCGGVTVTRIASIAREACAVAATGCGSSRPSRNTAPRPKCTSGVTTKRTRAESCSTSADGSLRTQDTGSEKPESSGSVSLASLRAILGMRAASVEREDRSSSITTTPPESFAASSADSATLRSVCSEILSRVFSAHLTTCAVRQQCEPNGPALIARLPADDYRDEKVWLKANPGLGTILPRRYLEEQVAEAAGMPSKQNIVRRLNFCEWTEQSERAIDMELWDACGGAVDEDALRGASCMVGLDAGSTSDLSAEAVLFGPDGDGCYDLICRFWMPAESLDAACRLHAEEYRLKLRQWADEGHILLTPGNVTDYDFIEAQVLKDAEKFAVREVAFDRWGISQLTTHLVDKLGEDRVIGVGQGFASMSTPTKELLKLIASRKIRHGGNPVMRWMASNLALEQDAAGNMKPDKKRSAEKIDGPVATITALARSIVSLGADGSVYDQREMVVL
jgi:phage terminase large subunit-like protein